MCPPLLAVTLRKSRLCTLLPSSIKWGHHPHCRDCWEDTRRAGTHGRVPTMYPDTASACLPSRPSSRLRGRPPTGVRVGHRGCLSLGLSLSTHRSQGSLQLPPTPAFVPRLSWFVPSPNILQERLGPRPPCSTRESCLLGTAWGREPQEAGRLPAPHGAAVWSWAELPHLSLTVLNPQIPESLPELWPRVSVQSVCL